MAEAIVVADPVWRWLDNSATRSGGSAGDGSNPLASEPVGGGLGGCAGLGSGDLGGVLGEGDDEVPSGGDCDAGEGAEPVVGSPPSCAGSFCKGGADRS
jgi:hypothetical protein